MAPAGFKRLTLDRRWTALVLSNLVQKQQGRARRWIIAELWGKPSHHVRLLDPKKVNSTFVKPHMAMDMKLQPSDTAPHASWLVLAQRGEFLRSIRKNVAFR